MNLSAILRQADTLGIVLSVTPEHQIHIKSATQPPPEFVQILRENKPEIVRQFECTDLERRVQDEGFVLCYADVLNDRVAFHLDDLDLTAIPSGFMPYSLSELALLFGPDQPDDRGG